MSSVTFPPAVGGDGSTVTDDANATTGLANGGHRTRFVPALAQVVAVANNTVTKATEAASSASAANTSKLAAQAAQTAAELALDSFDDRYLGSKTADPTVDNDGNALQVGAFYWNSTLSQMKVRSSSAWVVQSFVPTAATGVTFTPSGTIVATTVQTAIQELDTDVSTATATLQAAIRTRSFYAAGA